MKVCKHAFFLAAAFFFQLGLADAAPADQTSGPRLQLGEMKFDFGQVVEGTVLEHTFKVFNPGDQTLQIESVSPS